jgi:hypothetical protein
MANIALGVTLITTMDSLMHEEEEKLQAPATKSRKRKAPSAPSAPPGSRALYAQMRRLGLVELTATTELQGGISVGEFLLAEWMSKEQKRLDKVRAKEES